MCLFELCVYIWIYVMCETWDVCVDVFWTQLMFELMWFMKLGICIVNSFSVSLNLCDMWNLENVLWTLFVYLWTYMTCETWNVYELYLCIVNSICSRRTVVWTVPNRAAPALQPYCCCQNRAELNCCCCNAPISWVQRRYCDVYMQVRKTLTYIY